MKEVIAIGKFDLKNAEQVRASITTSEAKNIRRAYEQLYQEVTRKVANLGNGALQKQNLMLLQRDLKARIQTLNEQIKSGVVDDMRTTSQAVVEDTRTFLKHCGFKDSEIHNAFQYVPDQIVRNVLTGNVYGDGWTLSNAIWKHTQHTQGILNKIIGKGVAQGKSAFEVAKDIEKYVNPGMRKQSRKIDFINPRTGRKDTFYFGNVDYNAQRLARTLISHAYQQSFMNVNRNDPFVQDYIWHSAGIHGRTCDVCMERDGRHFKKDELPEDHPNGMCTYEAYIPDSMSSIADRIADWYEAPIGTYPDIDRYAMDF